MITDLTKLAVLLRQARLGLIRPDSVLSAEAEARLNIAGEADDGTPILWPAPSAAVASHMAVLAASGAGKTVMVANALLQEFVASTGAEESEQRSSFLIVDPKGDLVELILLGLAFQAPARFTDLLYLNPFVGGFAFNLNHLSRGKTPFDITAMQLANLVAEVSTSTGAQRHLGVGARQVDVLQHVLLGALDCSHPQASVLWSLDALTLRQGLKKLAALTSSERAKQFLSSAHLSDELGASCASRLRAAFAASADLERLVSSEACLQFSDLLAPGRLTLIDLGQPTGGLTSLQCFWANMLVRLAIEHLMERPSPWTGHHVRVVIDEAQIVAPVLADSAERVLTTGRSRGLSLVVLTQGTTLLEACSDTLLRVLLTNTPTKFIGRLSARDAELLAREQAPGPGIDESIGTLRSRFAASVCNLKDREFFQLAPGERRRFITASLDLEAWQKAAQDRRAEIAGLKTRLALPAGKTKRATLDDVAETKSKPRSPRRRSNRAPRSRWG